MTPTTTPDLDPRRPRAVEPIRRELEEALVRLPNDGLVFNRAEVEAIVEAVGGWTKLLAILENVQDPGVDRG